MRKQRTDDVVPADAESKRVAGDDRGQVLVLQLPDHSSWYPVAVSPPTAAPCRAFIHRAIQNTHPGTCARLPSGNIIRILVGQPTQAEAD